MASITRTLFATVERASDGDTRVARTENDTKFMIRFAWLSLPDMSHPRN
jgi:hypothetical protein